ncbi:MAG: glycosyltransferase family protein [Thermodesulfobacteriota bacterium]
MTSYGDPVAPAGASEPVASGNVADLLARARNSLAMGDIGAAVGCFDAIAPQLHGHDELSSLARMFQQVCLQTGEPAAQEQCRAILVRELWDRFAAYLRTGDETAFCSLLSEQEHVEALFSVNGAGDGILIRDGIAVFSGELEQLLGQLLDNHLGGDKQAQARRCLFEENMRLMAEHCHPFAVASLRQLSQHHPADRMVMLGGCLFANDGAWRCFSSVHLDLLAKNNDWHLGPNEKCAVVYCATPGVLAALVHIHGVARPDNIRQSRYVVVDFAMLLGLLHSCSFGALLGAGSHVCNFIDARVLRFSWGRFFSSSLSSLPTILLFFPPHTEREVRELIRETGDRFALEEKKNGKLLRAHYVSRAFPLDVANPQRPLRVMLITSRFTTFLQYSTRDIARGFEEIGWEAMVVQEDRWDGTGIRLGALQAALTSFLPDLVFCIDHFRHEFPGIPASVPFVTWVQDILPHMWEMTDPTTLGPHDHVFALSDGLRMALRGREGYLRCFCEKDVRLLPVPVNTSIYRPIPGLARSYDVIFVTHLPLPEETLEAVRRGTPPPDWTDDEVIFMRDLAERMDVLSIPSLITLLSKPARECLAREICTAVGLDFKQRYLDLVAPDSFSAFSHEISWQLKTRPIRHLMAHGIDVRVFGNNWQHYEGFKDIAMGVVSNGEPLNRLINEAKINLNSSGTIFHVRVAEVMGAGGFLLSRLVENGSAQELPDGFEIGRNFVVFEDEDDLLQKVRYFLAHDKERELIAEEGRQRVLASCSIKTAACKILEMVGAGKAKA